MSIGRQDKRGRLDDAALVLGERLAPGSLYRLLAEHGDVLFGPEYFADLFKATARGRPTVPARVVAAVMLLQAHEGGATGRRWTGWRSICGGRRRPG